MNRDDLVLDYYERIVESDQKKLDDFPRSLKERAYFEQGIFQHRAILHMQRSKMGLAVCRGAIDCLNAAGSKCKSGGTLSAKVTASSVIYVKPCQQHPNRTLPKRCLS
jgi:hypothetical protein